MNLSGRFCVRCCSSQIVEMFLAPTIPGALLLAFVVSEAPGGYVLSPFIDFLLRFTVHVQVETLDDGPSNATCFFM